VDPGDPLNAQKDTDCDGLSDAEEFANVYAAGLQTDPANPDTDGDGIPDGRELGRVGSVNPACAIGPDTDPSSRTSATAADSDADGIPDGLEDYNRNGRVDPNETNPAAVDTDADGLADGYEDSNKDGQVGAGEPNPRLKDTDGDGISDGVEVKTTKTDPVDPDMDGDSCPDGAEDSDQDGQKDLGETNPKLADCGTLGKADTDGDGLADEVEDRNGNGLVDPSETNPANADTDGDGLPDGAEDKNRNGTREATETDPRHWDTDCDGLVDGVNNAGQGWPGEDPNGNGQVDPGETDPTRPDSDNDGILDGVERGATQNPNPGHCPGFVAPQGGLGTCAAGAGQPCLLGTNPLVADTDGDGIPDGAEDTNQNGVWDPGELSPVNGGDGTGPAGQVCTVANLRPVQFKENGAADVQVAVGPGYTLTEMSVGGQVRGLVGRDAAGSVGFLAFRIPPPGGNPAGDEAVLRGQLNAVAPLNNNTTTQTFATWDGIPALQAFYETSGADTGTGLWSRLNALADQLVGPGAGTLPGGGPTGPFKLQVQYSHRSANSLAVVLAVTPLSNFVEPAIFTLSDTAGGSALAQFGDASGVQCETFQPVVAKVDFLFVVDDSCSMASSQGALAQAGQAMAGKLNNAALDYRIALVTTSYPGNGIRGFVDENGIQQFQDWLTQGAPGWVGTSGSGSEKCLNAAAYALSDMTQPGANPAFRPDANVVVVLLGDADDQSAPSPAQYTSYFNTPNSTLGNYLNRLTQKVPVHGIVCPVGQTCNGEPNNNRHGQVITDTGGIRGAINDNASIQNAMGLIVDSTIGAAGYKMLKPPIGASIKVALSAVQNPGACNASDLPRSRVNGFDFDGLNRTLSFFGACKPPSGTVNAAVSYRYWADTTPNPDGNPPPCASDPFFDPVDPDHCQGRLACNQLTNTCECPTACGGGVPPPGKVCNPNKYVCDFVCTPDCAGACTGYQECNVSACACECVQSATCAPGYSFQGGNVCGCVCNTSALSCSQRYQPDASSCACVCKSDCGGCPSGTTCNTSTCTCDLGVN
jgi:hypothetical protein